MSMQNMKHKPVSPVSCAPVRGKKKEKGEEKKANMSTVDLTYEPFQFVLLF